MVFSSIVAALALYGTDAPVTKTDTNILITTTEVSAIQKDAPRLKRVLAQCGTPLTYKPKPVSTYAPPRHYTETGPSEKTEEQERLKSDSIAAYKLALRYRLTGDIKYATASQRVLDAWARTLKTVTSPQGKSGMNFNMPYMIIAASWVKDASKWDQTSFKNFISTTVLPHSAFENPNNHGLWAVFLETSAGIYLGDDKRVSRARARWGEILKGAVGPDGTFIREIQRTDTINYSSGPGKGIRGMAYTHYAMLPASMAAKLFADAGYPVWKTSEGVLFGKAFCKAAAWTLNPESFPYYESNQGRLQGVREGSYFPLLLKHYPCPDAEAVIKQGDFGATAFVIQELFR